MTVLLVDVNVLVYAFREDAPGHAEHRKWVERQVGGDEPYAVSDHILGSFLRIVTHPRIFDPPTPIQEALAFAEVYRNGSNAVPVVPGSRQWGIFAKLCRVTSASGNLIPDAWVASLAIEQGCELITTDGDFARFGALRWRHPLAS